jgi:hypothetical protein
MFHRKANGCGSDGFADNDRYVNKSESRQRD